MPGFRRAISLHPSGCVRLCGGHLIARALAEQAGLAVVDVRSVIRVRPGGSRFDRLFAWVGRTPLRELFAFQFVLRCRK